MSNHHCTWCVKFMSAVEVGSLQWKSEVCSGSRKIEVGSVKSAIEVSKRYSAHIVEMVDPSGLP